MVKKKSKPEIIITPSGHEVDRDLARVPVKVSPSLQALIANQMELIDMVEGKAPRSHIFIEQHKIELLQVEEEIAGAFAGYIKKKEKAREKRLMKKPEPEKFNPAPVHVPDDEDTVFAAAAATISIESEQSPGERNWCKEEASLSGIPFDIINDGREPDPQPDGLPSSRCDINPAVQEDKKPQPDVRRIALGASIKALQNFLGRELTEEELQSLEAQVDSYLG